MCLLALKTTRADRRCCALPTRSISVQLRGNETQWPTVFLKNCLRHVLIYNSNCAERELFSLDALPERFKYRNHVTNTSASPPTAFIYTAHTVINRPSEQRCEDGGVISGILQFQKQKPRQFSCWGLTVGALQGSDRRVTLLVESLVTKHKQQCLNMSLIKCQSTAYPRPQLHSDLLGPQFHFSTNPGLKSIFALTTKPNKMIGPLLL